MIFLLGELRREMNGAVADSMHYYGKRYGLNYGVSLPTIRTIAAKEPQNNDLALYLYKQDVRELRLAALHIAEPKEFNSTKEAWRDGISTSEIAEELAFALLSKVETFTQIYGEWIESAQPLVVYSALMAAARHGVVNDSFGEVPHIIGRFPDSRLIAQGVIALLATAIATHAEKVRSIFDNLPDTPITDYIREELAWRME